jgi:spermidine synthase
MGLGRAVGANTLGGAVAPLLAGVLLLPAAGAKVAILLVSVGYLGVLLLVPRPRRLGIAAVPAVAGACLMLMPPLRFVEAPADGQLVDYREGVMAAVAVITDGAGDRHLKVDNHFTMGSTSSGFADHRQTHIPLLLHPQPQRALFLGVGTGMTMNAAQYHAGLEVTAVELVPEVLAMLKHFGTDPAQNHWSPEPRLLASDARRFVLASPERFDVIIADLFHPSRNGAGSLYTREHFDAVRRRLAPGGLFCQWLPLFQMDLETLQVITRTFADRFPYVQVHVPHFSLTQPVVGLIGSEVPFEYGPGWLQNRVRSVDLQQQLVALRLNSDFALFGGYLAGRRGLAHFAGDGALNTDNRPLVTYRAPVFAYRQQQGHGERLVALVEALRSQPGTLLARADSAGQAVFRDRMEAYWQARDAYLRAGLGVDPSDDLEGMLHQVREPLLEVVRISADFTPSYLPLLGMAESLYQVNPAAARDLLVDLDQAGPSRPEARALLRQLFSRRQEESH